MCVPAALVGVDWQALATLATGLLAVGAAIWVGRNQVEIQNKQTFISENSIKIQLLNDRRACIKSMRDLYFSWQREWKLSDSEWDRFSDLLNEMSLIFPASLTKRVGAAADAIFWARHHQKRSFMYRKNGDEQRAADRLEKSFVEEDKAMELMPSLLPMLIECTRIEAWAEK